MQKYKSKHTINLSFFKKVFMKCFHLELYSASTKKFTKITRKCI